MCTYGGDSHLDEGLAVDSILAMTFLYLFDTAYCYKKQLSETVNWYFESRISTFQEKHRGSVPLCVEICSFFKFCVQVSSSSVLRLWKYFDAWVSCVIISLQELSLKIKCQLSQASEPNWRSWQSISIGRWCDLPRAIQQAESGLECRSYVSLKNTVPMGSSWLSGTVLHRILRFMPQVVKTHV